MIDSQLIEQCSQQARTAVIQRQITEFDSVWVVQQVLTDQMIEKIRHYIQTVSADQWSLVPGQERSNRRAIVWQADTVIEELHEVFARITPEINDMFGSDTLNFIGIQLWTDGVGYDTGLHQDNETIDVSCQVYLFDNDPALGTSFVHGDQRVDIPYINNTGYLMINNRDQHLLHGTSRATPAGVERYSIYSVWSLSPKK
jgi:hypothetical protein